MGVCGACLSRLARDDAAAQEEIEMSETKPQGVAVVTGAASGMGLAAAKLMSQAGWALLLCDLNAERLETTAAELRGAGPVGWRPW